MGIAPPDIEETWWWAVKLVSPAAEAEQTGVGRVGSEDSESTEGDLRSGEGRRMKTTC